MKRFSSISCLLWDSSHYTVTLLWFLRYASLVFTVPC